MFAELAPVAAELAPVAAALATLRALDAARLDDVGAFVAELSKLVDAFEAERARFVHEADQRGCWARAGATSPEAWLAATTASSRRTAAERSQLGTTLAAAPVLAAAVGDGRVSPDAARTLAPVVSTAAFAANGPVLVDAIAGLRPAQAARARDEWLASHDPAREEANAAEVFARRSVTVTEPDTNGVCTMQVVLPPQQMRTVRNALDHLIEGQRLDGTGRTRAQRAADALVELCDAYTKGDVTGGRGAPTMLVAVGYTTLLAGGSHPARLATGETITAREARRLALNANLHRVITGPASEILDYGRARRLASRSQYNALVVRDQGCRWPGCDRPPGWCEIDHLDDWTPKRGRTDLDRLVLFCSRHHHQRHQPGHQLHGSAADLTIELPDGRRLRSLMPDNRLDESPLDRPNRPLPEPSAEPSPGPSADARARLAQIGDELALALTAGGAR